jgi:hypothetical protein
MTSRAARTAVLLLVALIPAVAQPAKPVVLNKTIAPPTGRTWRIAPQTFRNLEKFFDARLDALVPNANEPADLLVPTIGIHIDGFGVVFTAAVSLVKTPELSPFLKEIPKDLPERVQKLRIERLPLLKAVMSDMLNKMAMSFVQVPSDQQLVLAVRLYYASWESSAGMPAQVMMRATRAGVQTGEILVEEQ